MKKLMKITVLLAVFLVSAGLVNASVFDGLIGKGRYGASFATTTVDQTVPVTFGGRYNHIRVVFRIWLEPTGANTVPVVWMTDGVVGDTEKLFSFPTVADGEESTLDLLSGQFVSDGSGGTQATNIYPVVLRYGDTLSIYDSLTNAVTTYRVEYIDIRQ